MLHVSCCTFVLLLEEPLSSRLLAVFWANLAENDRKGPMQGQLDFDSSEGLGRGLGQEGESQRGVCGWMVRWRSGS